MQPAAFYVRPPCGLGVSRVHFVLYADVGESWHIDMQPVREGEQTAYFCLCAVPTPGLYWYAFDLDTNEGPRKLVREKGGRARLAGRGDADNSWQLTVYDPAFQTPDWLAGGTMYQVFPDRFCRSGETPAGLSPERILQKEWAGTPPWRAVEEPAAFSNTYYGGNLAGIIEKLPYLRGMGVTVLYLNPIFEAHSNHRYNTADYLKIDPLLGTEETFRVLCAKAEELGISVLLDGVFGHTGDDSVYFNRTGRYGAGGAYNDMKSPYFSWYSFSRWPDQYRCWWNFNTLPQVNQDDASFTVFVTGKDGVLTHWMRAGAKGWRLDVADELAEPFLRGLRARVKEENPQGAVIGEVWEDASNKMAYGQRRSYFQGQELDGAMNYPFRSAIIAFLRGGDAEALHLTVTGIYENYPAPAMRAAMNLLGTHDTPRILTALAGESGEGHDRAWKSETHLSPEARGQGLALLRLAFAILFFLPGVPCVYYGDEAGMEGYDDPFCRAPYPWGHEDRALADFVRALAHLRAACRPLMKDGVYRTLYAAGDLFAFLREDGAGERLLCAINRGQAEAALPPPANGSDYRLLLGARGVDFWCVPAGQCKIFGAGRWLERAGFYAETGERLH